MKNLNIARTPDLVKVELEEGWENLKRSNNNWQGQGVNVLFKKVKQNFKINLQTEKSIPVKRILLRWNQKITGKIKVLGDHWERGYGDLEWRGLVPGRILPWYFLLNDGQFTTGCGVKTGPAAFCSWRVDTSGVSLYLDVRSAHRGVVLGDRVLEVAEIITYQGQKEDFPFQVARDFCQKMCSQPRLPEEPVYGGNNWYYAYGDSSARQILENSQLISSLSLNNENRPYMVVDDGWQLCHGHGSDGGPWHQGNYKFPDMSNLAGEMKKSGVKPGIWIRPLVTSQKVPQSWVRYEIKNDTLDFIAQGTVLDPSVPEVLEFIKKDITRLRSWGYQLIKHDFTTYDIFGKWGFEMGANLTDFRFPFSNKQKTSAEIITDLYQTIARAAGNSVVIGCNTVSHLAAGIFELQRIGDDTSGREWERTRKMGVNSLAYRITQHDNFYVTDPDCVGITKDVPWELNKQWLELVSQSGTPLFVSLSPEAVGKKQKSALKKALQIASQKQPVAEPLDWMETNCPVRWKLRGKEVEFDWFNQN